MIRRQKRREYPPGRPLSNWAIALGILVFGIAVAAWIVLVRRYVADPRTLDAIRTAGTLVVGTGGAIALLLAARRQRSTELTLVHTERDATERRITELYTRAADQLGSDQAPVRLAGLYALERLAHNTVEHRQTIVDVICAYLRMPYTPPPGMPQAGVYRGPRPRRRRQVVINDRHSRSGATPTDRHEQSRQERQVRLTAQDILSRNLRRLPNESPPRWWAPWRGVYREPPWPGIQLNLNRALLLGFSLATCRIGKADFTGAQFTGAADFSDAQFTGAVSFEGAQFTGAASFESAQFTGAASFESAQFTGVARFDGALFTGAAHFANAQFADATSFSVARFYGTASFNAARFTDTIYFFRVRFTGMARFDAALFTDVAFFDRARFTDVASFNAARFTDVASFNAARFWGGAFFNGAHTSGTGSATVWPLGWTTQPAQLDNEEDRYLVRSEDPPGLLVTTVVHLTTVVHRLYGRLRRR